MGEEEGCEKIAFLPKAQRIYAIIVRRTFRTAIPRMIVVIAILVPLAVRVVVFVVVAHEIVQRETIMRDQEIDRGIRPPAITLVQCNIKISHATR